MYTRADLTCAQRRAQREVGIALALVAAGIAVAVTALVMRNRIMGYAGLVLCSALAYARYALFASPWRKYARYVDGLFAGLSHQGDGWFVDIEETPRLSEDGVLVRGVTVRDSEGGENPLMYYWDARYPFPSTAAGQKLGFTTYGRYIRTLHIDSET